MLLEKLTAIVGDANVLTGEQVRSRAVGWADHSPCQARAIVRPGSTDEVSRVLAACHAAGQPVVLFGGLTGLVRGCVAGEHEIALSLERMHRIESIDPVGRTMTRRGRRAARSASRRKPRSTGCCIRWTSARAARRTSAAASPPMPAAMA